MKAAPFRERLEESIEATGAALCVGIDPDPSRIPAGLGEGIEGVRRHTLAVIEATAPYAAAFKPNLAFFERLGPEGFQLLIEVVRSAGRHALVIADAKRGDIGNTAKAYAAAIYDVIGADGCTVNGYLGHDSLIPFIERPDRFAFIVCRTSNPGASDFQDLILQEGAEALYLHLARRAVEWNTIGTVGLVAGATWPAEIARIREVAPQLPLLLPGVGSQGGDLRRAVEAAAGPDGQGRYLVNVSRAIAQASRGADFAEAAGRAAADLRNQIRALTSAPAQTS
ncbi:MAG TPA: orotidine-5'-phosphate decarboxylase [Candidatus Dormibacteraeota bacterium]|nr:orotidine-5'-phosphate decarboxylase [Candidatus Dormibacteraeota bacterium]